MHLRSLHPVYTARRLRQMVYERTHPEEPWLVPSAITLLDAWLKPEDQGLEWGSGRSTRWFASRVAHLISVENHPEWAETVRGQLSEWGVADQVDYRHIPCDLEQRHVPDSHPYCDVALDLEDASLDFALVDGRIRHACLMRAIDKVKPGGLLILDNAERFVPNRQGDQHTTFYGGRDAPPDPRWGETLQRLEGWRWIHCTNGLWDTRMWVRPEKDA